MRIGLLAPPVVRVPPKRYGGTERVVATLADALVERGHDVTLFASGDSLTQARLVPTVERALWDDDRYADATPFWSLAVSRAYNEADELDLMHNHTDYFAYSAARLAAIPTVTTLHGRLDLPELRPVYAEFREQRLVSVSDAQRLPLPKANWIGTVYHGLPRDLYTPRFEPGEYLAFCGRISPDKGVHRAIDIALAAGLPLKIAARLPLANGSYPEATRDHEYYENVIRPMLRHPLVEYVGELSEGEQGTFYANALALLFPIDWPEPFGLVVIEALACGTPVLATPRGSVPELVMPGETGALCVTTEQFLQAIDGIRYLDRRACRVAFEDRFTAEAMASAYEMVYARALWGTFEPAEEKVPV